MRSYFFASVLGISLVLGGCSASSEEDSASGDGNALSNPSSTLAPVKIDESRDGETISVPKGADLQVALQAMPDAGLFWKVVATNRTFGGPQPNGGVITPGPNPGITDGGTQTFTWKTSGSYLQPSATIHRVRLEYRKDGDDPSAPALKTFSFGVLITDPNIPVEPAPVQVTEDQSGQTVRAIEGQDVVVKLEQNASTGYAWYVSATDRTFGYPETSVSPPDGTAPVGAPGTATFTWKTKSFLSMVGRHRVVLSYGRGTDGPVAKTFELTVDVVGAQ
jgi:predicted secreted protein